MVAVMPARVVDDAHACWRWYRCMLVPTHFSPYSWRPSLIVARTPSWKRLMVTKIHFSTEAFGTRSGGTGVWLHSGMEVQMHGGACAFQHWCLIALGWYGADALKWRYVTSLVHQVAGTFHRRCSLSLAHLNTVAILHKSIQSQWHFGSATFT